jgi:hypothetical protein
MFKQKESTMKRSLDNEDINGPAIHGASGLPRDAEPQPGGMSAEAWKYLEQQFMQRADHILRDYGRKQLKDDAMMFPNRPARVVEVAGMSTRILALGSARNPHVIVGYNLVPETEPYVDRCMGPEDDLRRVRLYPYVDGMMIRHYGFSLVNGTLASESHHVVWNLQLVEITPEEFWDAFRAHRKALADRTVANIPSTDPRRAAQLLEICRAIAVGGFRRDERAEMLDCANRIEAALGLAGTGAGHADGPDIGDVAGDPEALFGASPTGGTSGNVARAHRAAAPRAAAPRGERK